MANHKSAKKRARQTERRTVVNTARRSRVRSSIKKVEEAIAAGDKTAATAALKAAQPEIQRGACRDSMRASRRWLDATSHSEDMNAARSSGVLFFARRTEENF